MTQNSNSPENKFPLWLLLLLVAGGYLSIQIFSDETHRDVFRSLAGGLWITVRVTVTAFVFACGFGLLLALARNSKIYLLSQFSRLYIEVARGVPMLVILYYFAFIGAPVLAEGINLLISPLTDYGWLEPLQTRDLGFEFRATAALVVGYCPFLAEIFRAGFQSVEKGQRDAAASIGLSRRKVTFLVVLPQAFRNILPALANDLIAMLKDSSLVSLLGVQDITQLAKVYASASFLFFETYNLLAYFYLFMTLSLSLLARYMEKKLLVGHAN